ncbi:hypothetical protein P5485_013720 [Bacillus pumilus]|uniref:hypothetical protein n=1 Tax=Bacillus TaxID=1386 RepID=UPI0007765163|nr:hypothetical protein [Bacillus pumilus]AMM98291.1 hypothetical protein UP12_13380 [Bacillus pumilus]MCY9674485.1 hypothetical protein [Bacillus pumilus]MDH3152460.1 hypothetical protein [Bacillus pumilus]MEB2358713.1 hypothetical protein [Bacillus pumilus]
MTHRLKQYFFGYFLYFPCSFLIIYFIWMKFVKSVQMGEVMSNYTSIIGIYYIITSVWFIFLMQKQAKQQ